MTKIGANANGSSIMASDEVARIQRQVLQGGRNNCRDSPHLETSRRERVQLRRNRLYCGVEQQNQKPLPSPSAPDPLEPYPEAHLLPPPTSPDPLPGEPKPKTQTCSCRKPSPMGRWSARKGLTKFEKLIRDAIALLIKRGEISISRKKPRPSPPTNKQKDK